MLYSPCSRRLTTDIPYLLTSGDEIRVGQTTLVYQQTGSDARDDQFVLQEGIVPEEGEHIKISYQPHPLAPGQQRQFMARFAPGPGKSFVIAIIGAISLTRSPGGTLLPFTE